MDLSFQFCHIVDQYRNVHDNRYSDPLDHLTTPRSVNEFSLVSLPRFEEAVKGRKGKRI